MQKYVNAEVMHQTMQLKQMGAKVTVISSKMCYATFTIHGIKLSYVYNVNKKGKYFLERIKPYPLPLREFDQEDDVIEIIKIDLEQYENASKSHNMDKFIGIAKRLDNVFHRFEDLFLYYNLSAEETGELMEMIDGIDNKIESIKSHSERVFTKKEPEHL